MSVQYGLNINKCQEIKNVQNTNKKLITKESLKKISLIFVVGILLSRVSLLLNQSDSRGIAPFGIAYLLAVTIRSDKKNNIVAALGVAVGYLTISKLLTDGKIYLIATGVLTLYYTIVSLCNKKKRESIGFGLILISFFIYGLLINKYELGVNLTLCLVETVVIIPIYYVIKYALDSLGEIKSNYFFSSEEVVSIGILFCLLVAGIGNINIMNYSIRNIFALALVLGIAYVGGATYGAMIGVSMGIILGVASNDMMSCVGFFGVGGLVVGIFKDTGKIFSILAGIIIYFALGLYSNGLTLQFGIEVLASSILFLCIPRSVCNSIEVEINSDSKKSSIENTQLNSIKEEFTFKLKELTSVLTTVSKCLGTNNDNENLLIKGKGSALVENLADRCCSNCENRSACWKRDFNQTYNSFQLLIQSYEDGNLILPKNLEKKCVKNFTLLRNTEGIVNNYTVNETIKERLAEGRTILSDHVNNISSTLDNLLNDFKRQVIIDSDTGKRIKRELNKISVDYNDVFCYVDTNGRIKIKISIDNYEGADYYGKSVVPLLSKMMRKSLCICEGGSCINTDTNECIITIEEAQKYYMVSYGAKVPKSGESQTGDSYTFGKTTDGCYTTILSDGMGFGPEAEKESKATVDLVEKFMEAGFDENVTVNTVNSIMGMRFAEDEKYATLDLSRVNLYNGDATFVKIGAAPSFIKRGNKVKAINSKNLPFGLVDEVEVEFIKEQLKPGDLLISISDGILDIDKMETDKFIWLEEYLKNINGDPRRLSERILEKAKELSNESIKDDMTVVVSKLYLAS